jgi:hypothetical protein
MTQHRSLAGIALRLVLAAFIAIVVAGGVSAANPPSTAASTPDTMEEQLLALINDARADLHLKPLRLHSGLVDFAGDRAASQASSSLMKHLSCLPCALNSRGIQWYSAGEVLAYTTYPRGAQAAESIFNGWKGSHDHWVLLTSSKFNYIGLGVAYRSSEHKTFAAGLLSESTDRTKPSAKVSATSRSGTTVAWSWSGADPALQTHTAGLKNYDVQYRVGTGSWSTLKSGTTTKAVSLSGRAHGHWYGLRVRARDKAGNVSSYSTERRVWVP